MPDGLHRVDWLLIINLGKMTKPGCRRNHERGLLAALDGTRVYKGGRMFGPIRRLFELNNQAPIPGGFVDLQIIPLPCD